MEPLKRAISPDSNAFRSRQCIGRSSLLYDWVIPISEGIEKQTALPITASVFNSEQDQYLRGRGCAVFPTDLRGEA